MVVYRVVLNNLFPKRYSDKCSRSDGSVVLLVGSVYHGWNGGCEASVWLRIFITRVARDKTFPKRSSGFAERRRWCVNCTCRLLYQDTGARWEVAMGVKTIRRPLR